MPLDKIFGYSFILSFYIFISSVSAGMVVRVLFAKEYAIQAKENKKHDNFQLRKKIAGFVALGIYYILSKEAGKTLSDWVFKGKL